MLESAPGICTIDRVASAISTRAAITATIANLERVDDTGTLLDNCLDLPLLGSVSGTVGGFLMSPFPDGALQHLCRLGALVESGCHNYGSEHLSANVR